MKKFPQELLPLTRIPNWVTWGYRMVEGKKTKPPYKARNPNAFASVTNPNTWSKFNEVVSLRRKGFVLAGSGFCAFDLDDCINEYGELSPGAQELMKAAQSYQEITPSRRGVRIIGTTNKPPGSFVFKLKGWGKCEVYYNAPRYITITGEKIDNYDIKPLDSLIDKLQKIHGHDHDHKLDLSRSGQLMKQVAKWTAQGLNVEEIEEKIRSSPNRYKDIVDKYITVKRDRLYEEIERCASKVTEVSNDIVEEINKKYALLRSGNRLNIMCFDKGGDEEFSLLPMHHFKTWVASEPWAPKITSWLESPNRRQYYGVVFEPNTETEGLYNLWDGFAVEPAKGRCDRFLQHIHENICSGNDDLYDWVVGWFAQLIQFPREKLGTSLVLRGKSGVGKTKVGDVMRSLLGKHYTLVSDPRYITGHFNSHLMSCLLLHADEAFWAGDHVAASKLKDLVTGEWQYIEYKGRDPIKVRNYLRLFVTGNPDWLVPAAVDERRFAVIDVGDRHQQDHKYFAAIDREMASGGKEALLEYLLSFDTDKTDLRTIPPTAALLDQKINSMESKELWWMNILDQGHLPSGSDRKDSCPTSPLISTYYEHSQLIGVKRRSAEIEVGRFLSKYVPGLRKTRLTMGRRLASFYFFPPLMQCRNAFSSIVHQEIKWSNSKSEWVSG